MIRLSFSLGPMLSHSSAETPSSSAWAKKARPSSLSFAESAEMARASWRSPLPCVKISSSSGNQNFPSQQFEGNQKLPFSVSYLSNPPHKKSQKIKFEESSWEVKKGTTISTHAKNIFSLFVVLWVGSRLFVFSPERTFFSPSGISRNCHCSKHFPPRGFRETVIDQNVSLLDVL